MNYEDRMYRLGKARLYRFDGVSVSEERAREVAERLREMTIAVPVEEPSISDCPFPDDLELPSMVYMWTNDDDRYVIDTTQSGLKLLNITLNPKRSDDWDWTDDHPDDYEPQGVSFDFAMAFAKEEELAGVYVCETDRTVYVK